MIGSGPFKGENIDVGQLSFYAQDELLATDRLKLTFGVRVDFPIYFTDPVDNPFSRGLTALDENRRAGDGGPEQAARRQAAVLSARRLQLERGRRPQHAAPRRHRHLHRPCAVRLDRQRDLESGRQSEPVPDRPAAIPTQKDATLAQSFDLNAMDPDFKWPQTWTTDLAIDQQLAGGMLGTLEVIYGEGHQRRLHAERRPAWRRCALCPTGGRTIGGVGRQRAAIPTAAPASTCIDNTNEGTSFNVTAQLRKTFGSALNASRRLQLHRGARTTSSPPRSRACCGRTSRCRAIPTIPS